MPAQSSSKMLGTGSKGVSGTQVLTPELSQEGMLSRTEADLEGDRAETKLGKRLNHLQANICRQRDGPGSNPGSATYEVCGPVPETWNR